MALPNITQEINTIKANYKPNQIIFDGVSCDIKKSDSNGRLVIRGGTNWGDGAIIILGGNSDTTDWGKNFNAITFDDEGNQTNRIMLSSSGLAVSKGNITVNGNNVITSAGGTMKNTITCSSSYTVAIQKENATSMLTLRSSNDWNGGCIHLWGGNNSGNYPGAVEIIPRTVDGDGNSEYTVFRFRKNGDFEIGTKPIKYITDTYTSGFTFYRVWSDGWIEQGGRLTPTSGGQNVTLPKPFKSASYHVQATNCDSANTRGAQGWVVSTSVVKIRATAGTSASSTPCYWYACGY